MPPIVADGFSDETSESESEGSDLTSMSSSALQMPNDEEEQDRMDLAHHMSASPSLPYSPSPALLTPTNRWLMLMKCELFEAPVTHPQKILDLGTGTGIWGIDIAHSQKRMSLATISAPSNQPNWVAPSLEFIVEDFEDEWLYPPNNFDFIHARLLAGCVADWPKFIQKIYTHLKPGGYFEIQESAVWVWSDDGTLPADSAMLHYVQALNAVGRASSRELNIYDKLHDWLVDAGFEDFSQFTYPLPYSPWPRDLYHKEIDR
ncbi:hypothetical protein NUU61_002393 [Penicillium alfredii]|uniref:S-adenosyl-L-methionine-dependent methyltransferase n=1 Tax=Penicillium alfredii TaxID=1506179 RepID=A0A9W9KGK7_9EURO|nr:uncharacterized protein NUU61_002393 [Penicillium alfredii]KAJ5105046.1 hypothetical protein NUU61_002393 [Penicillium alfredii]